MCLMGFRGMAFDDVGVIITDDDVDNETHRKYDPRLDTVERWGEEALVEIKEHGVVTGYQPASLESDINEKIASLEHKLRLERQTKYWLGVTIVGLCAVVIILVIV